MLEPFCPPRRASLVSLPADALTELFEFLQDEISIGALWLCGSKSLNQKMAEGGAIRRLRLDQNNFVVLGWPSMVSSLPYLEEISINYSPNVSRIRPWKIDMLSLPRTVRKIQLQVAGAFEALCEALETNSSHFEKLEYLEIIFPPSVQSSNRPTLHACQLPRNLRLLSLNLYGRTYTGDLEIAGCPDFTMDDLPPCLESLTLQTLRVLLPPSGARYPDSLTQLRLSVQGIDTQMRNGLIDDMVLPHRLPDGLVSLEISFSNSDNPKTVLRSVPRTVTELSIFYNFDYVFGKEDVESLPPGLVDFEIFGAVSLSPELLLLLPQTLETVPTSFLEQCMSPSVRSALPPKLKLPWADTELYPLLRIPPPTLEIKDLETIPISLLPLPSTITRLEILHMNLEWAKKLFSTSMRLQQLTITTIEKDQVEDVLKCLPDRLNTLFLIDMQASELETILRNLPSQLRDLNVSVESSVTINTDYSKYLPRTLERLNILVTDPSSSLIKIEPASWFSNLPDYLVALEMNAILTPAQMSALSSQCTKLCYLTLFIDHELIRNPDDLLECFRALPRSLLNLSLTQYDDPEGSTIQLPTYVLALLPHRLQVLNLMTLTLDPEAAKVLPRGLKECLVDWGAWDMFEPVVSPC